jgi:predicted small lipoprotein YifL
MKVTLSALLLPILLGVTACAQSEPVQADPDEIEAAVKEANEQAAAVKDTKGAS